MTSPETHVVTRLLHEWKNGDSGALDELMPIVYRELRRIAGRLLSGERPGHTLPATALVHDLDEAILIGSKATDIVLDLDEALDRLAIQDARKSEIIQLLFFGGLTCDETADALNISPATVHSAAPLLWDAVRSAHNSPFPLLPWQLAEADSAMGAYLAKRGQVSQADNLLRNVQVAMQAYPQKGMSRRILRRTELLERGVHTQELSAR